MAHVEGEIVIHRPVEDVFDFVADERTEPRYNPRRRVAELISDGPVGPGSRFHTELQTRGRRLPMTVEFTEFDRPRRLASATHSSMMDTAGALTFEQDSDGTQMSWSWDVEPRGLLRLMPAVVQLLGGRQEREVWGNLKRLLESAPVKVRSSVLVAYASEHGATQGIAERIGARLVERGAHVDVRRVSEVDDVSPYSAVILGSPVYGGRWITDAIAFARHHDHALHSRSVWLFSVGSFGDTHRVLGRMMRREPREVGELQKTLRPAGYRVFAGAIARHQWPLSSRLFFHAFGGHFGDNRDWPEIDGWTNRIAATLAAHKC